MQQFLSFMLTIKLVELGDFEFGMLIRELVLLVFRRQYFAPERSSLAVSPNQKYYRPGPQSSNVAV